VNPFYSLWATPFGTRLALALIIAAGISASLYFIFLSWMVWRVFRNISAKRTALPAMSAVRRLHYQGELKYDIALSVMHESGAQPKCITYFKESSIGLNFSC